MQISKQERDELVERIFTKREVFEEYVLNVVSDEDRLEIMDILSERLINDLLKYELNFVHMKDFENFNFSLIRNLLFKEIASEWVDFAQHELYFSKDEALDKIQNKKMVLFLLALVKWYFTKYKQCYTDRIADSFIKLIELMPNAILENEIVKKVLLSDFIKNKNVAVVHNYSQLYNRVQDAKKNKNMQLSTLQVKLSDLYLKLKDQEEAEQDTQQTQKEISKFERSLELLKTKELAFFDDAIKRVRNTMSAYMLGISTFPPKGG